MDNNVVDDDSNEFKPLVSDIAPESSRSPFYMCSFSLSTYILIPICAILDLLAIWYRQTFFYIAAVSISVLFCCKSFCWASLLIFLQCFVRIYYHVFVMNCVHASLKVGSLQFWVLGLNIFTLIFQTLIKKTRRRIVRNELLKRQWPNVVLLQDLGDDFRAIRSVFGAVSIFQNVVRTHNGSIHSKFVEAYFLHSK